MATPTQVNALTALYVGYFDRAPDPVGLNFWIDQIDNGREFNTVSEDFAASPEAEALYPYLTTPSVSSPDAFVIAIYANLFGRAPDADGQAFWSSQLADGNVSAADMIEAIINGARDDAAAGTSDKTVLDNKVAVGLDFAQKAGDTPGFTYSDADAAAAHAVLDGVTHEDATVDAAKDASDAYLETGEMPGDNPGDLFTLSNASGFGDGLDTIVGTAGNDTIRAVLADSLNTGDIIDGGAGYNTMNISAGAFKSGAKPTISNVQEIINSNFGKSGANTGPGGAGTGGVYTETETAMVLDLARVSDLEAVWSDFSGTDSSIGTHRAVYENASADTVFGVSNLGEFTAVPGAGKGTVSIRGLDADDTLQVALDGNAEDSYVNVLAAGVKNVTIDSADGNSGNIVLDGAVENITVTGAGDLSYGHPTGGTLLNNIVMFDASATTGTIEFESGALTGDYAAIGGSGDNTLDFSGVMDANARGTISGGAGDDILIGGAGSDTIDGGAGADTMTGGAGDDTFVVEGGVQDGTYDIITDFLDGSNSIKFVDGVAGSADNFIVYDENAADAITVGSFTDTREAANAQLDGDIAYVAVEYGGNTYVYSDLNGDGSADVMVQLSGVTGATDADFGFITA